ncbi:MAG: hypothetical protein IT364_18920 [Candidatus Hydrogenedentes bacterium]|nr:hypothetical protein [Candidatus Hydrogenedentota bacterium]
MRYQVANDDEFRAYWHTLIDVANNAPLEFTADGKLIANDEDGNIFELKPITPGESMATVPLTWEFLSSDMTETALRSRGITTLFSGSNIEYIPYPGRFPCTPTVAELSHRFVVGLSVD